MKHEIPGQELVKQINKIVPETRDYSRQRALSARYVSMPLSKTEHKHMKKTAHVTAGSQNTRGSRYICRMFKLLRGIKG